MRPSIADALSEIGVAAQLLTRLPIGDAVEWTETRAGRSPRWYPLVGALVGVAVALVYVALIWMFPPSLAALGAVGFGMLLTGCLHEDGLADLCDGLGGGATRERALEIMRDSRIGAFGALGLGLVVAATAMVLADLPPVVAAMALIAGHAASRAAIVFVMLTSDYARADGAARHVAQDASDRGVAQVVPISVAVALAPLALVAGLPAVFCGLVGLALGVVVIRRAFLQRLDGYTGDCLGATQQIGALGFYLGLAAWI